MSTVLSIKYRPKNFEEIVGQDAISSTLSLALKSNRLSHAYLFSGLRGSGKTSTARIFSKALLCKEGPTATPCEICTNCKMASENRHIDILELDAASNRNIDDIRDIIEQSKYKPSIGKYKVFIIDEVHMLTKQAFNALLKTLEEPPEYVKFILATTDALKVPATILSRTQHFRFRSIAKNDILNHIISILKKENIKYEDEAVEAIARNGSGSLRDTLTMLDQAIIYSKGNITNSSVANMLGAVDKRFLDKIFLDIFNKDIQAIKDNIKELESYEADTIIDEIVAYIKTKMFNNDDKFSIPIIDRFFRILNDSKYLLSINSDSGFVISLMFFKMVEALKIKDIDDMINELEDEITDKTKSDNQNRQTTSTNNYINTDIKTKTTMTPNQMYDLLTKNILNHSSQVGECFAKSFEFISFENRELKILNNASEDCREKLRVGYSKIKMMIQDIFGANVKIMFIKKNIDNQKSTDNNKDDIENNPIVQKAAQMLNSQKIHITTLVKK